MIIAIDGPSGAGKSTVARLLAKKLGFEYIDTGAMYRAVALKVLSSGAGARDGVAAADEEAITVLLADTDIGLDGERVLLDGEDVSALIRTPEVSMEASRVSALPAVREKLVALQRGMGEKKSVVMDGRDIGSNVFPGADFKFFVTASPGVRAERRYRELLAKGENISFGDVLDDTVKRDYDDSHRALNPLVKVDDATEIVTDGMSISEVLEALLKCTTVI